MKTINQITRICIFLAAIWSAIELLRYGSTDELNLTCFVVLAGTIFLERISKSK